MLLQGVLFLTNTPVKNQQQKQNIKIFHLLSYISADKLQPLIDQHHADFSANKLHTIVFLKLFLYAWAFDREALSLRTIAEYSHSETFKELAAIAGGFSVGKSSLGERLARIPYQLFQDLFEQLAQETLQALPPVIDSNQVVERLLKQSRIIDSTVLTQSAKLLKAGYKMHPGQLNIKATVAIAGRSIPIKALILTTRDDINENNALPKLIDTAQRGLIYIFDKGIHKRETYADIVASGNHFLSRITAKHYTVVQQNPLPELCETATLEIIQDSLIVFPKELDKTQTVFRLIITVSKQDDQELCFITSLTDIPVVDLTELYRYRWSIEVFFRFLKQELKLESLLSYNENGMKVHIYLTLIAFLLTWTFKEQNNIASFKRAREKLKLGLLDLLMQQIFEEGFKKGQQKVNVLDTS